MLYTLPVLVLFPIRTKAFGVQPSLLSLVSRSIARVSAIIVPIALNAETATGAAGCVVGILRRELVAVYAMCFTGVLGEGVITSQRVYSTRHSLKMYRVYAGGIAAKMIRRQLWRVNDRDEGFVNESLGSNFIVPRAEPSVSAPILTGSPNPTRNAFERYVRVYLDLAEKASEKFAVYRESIRISFKHRCLLSGNGVGLV